MISMFFPSKLTQQVKAGTFVAMLIFSVFSFRGAHAQQLATVTGVEFDGALITWNELPGAAGYNIYLNLEYLDTVRSATQYPADVPGEYRIVAFDQNGNFSPLFSSTPETVPAIDSEPTENIPGRTLEPPRNVLGISYSSIAGEVFWDRFNAQSLSYTVTLNGETVGTTNGTSFLVTPLLKNEENFVTVSATNPTGATSDLVTLVFDSTANRFPASAMVFDPAATNTEQVTAAVQSPQGVRLDVYSHSNAELFWSRETLGIGITTEIYRNGELVGSTLGSSFYDDDRVANTEYTYELVTVAPNAIARSEATTVNPDGSVSTTGAIDTENSNDETTDDNPTSVAVNSPVDVRLEIYSSQQAELFWSRSTLGPGITTEVFRNDVFLGSTEGNSFFDNGRETGTVYTYELVTVSPDGNIRSAPTIVNPTAFDDEPENIATNIMTGVSRATLRNPHTQWTEYFFDIAFGEFTDQLTVLDSTSSFIDGVETSSTTYACTGTSGFAENALVIERKFGFSSTTTMEFIECDFDRALIEGVVTIANEGGLRFSTDYSVAIFADDIVDMDGKVTESIARGTDARTITYTEFSYYIEEFSDENFDDFIETAATLNQTISFAVNNIDSPSRYEGSATINASWTNNRTLNLTTTELFLSNADSSNYISGAYAVEMDNGEQLTLSASTGNDDTWFVEIFTTSGSSSIEGEWTDDNRLPCILLTEVCF